jgi:large subunit ribosomal protein L12
MEYVYAALLLHKTGQEISEANMKKVIEATGAKADDSKIKSLLASLKGIDIEKELETATVAAAAPAAGSGEQKSEAEEKKEEKEEESAEGLSALFG